MCPDGVVAHHESLSSFRPGFESRSGRYQQVRNGEIMSRTLSPSSPFLFHAVKGTYHNFPAHPDSPFCTFHTIVSPRPNVAIGCGYRDLCKTFADAPTSKTVYHDGMVQPILEVQANRAAAGPQRPPVYEQVYESSRGMSLWTCSALATRRPSLLSRVNDTAGALTAWEPKG